MEWFDCPHTQLVLAFHGVSAEVNCLAYWFIAPYIRDIPHLNDGQAMSKLIPATERGTMGRTFLTGDAAFKAPGRPGLAIVQKFMMVMMVMIRDGS